MKRNRIVTLLSLLLTLCLLAAIPAASSETGAAGLEIDTEESILCAPVDDAVEEIGEALLGAEAAHTEENPLGIGLTSANFPDPQFYLYLADMIDVDHDFVLSEGERSVPVIAVHDRDIASLSGIRYFPHLQELYCGSNRLTSLDVSGLSELKKIWCMDNSLQELNVSGCEALEEVAFYNNRLVTLDFSGCAALKSLNGYGNPLLEVLRVAGCASLEFLDVKDAKVRLLDLADCASLRQLYCQNNQLVRLDVTGCAALEEVICDGNQLTSLDLGGHAALTRLYATGNRLTGLDVTGCAALATLYTQGNQLSSLDVTGCPKLIGCAQGASAVRRYDEGLGIHYVNLFDDSGDVTFDETTVLTAGGATLYDPAPEPVSIGNCEITGIKAQVYTGKAIKPKPVVKYGGETLVKDTDYKLSYKDNKKIGTATVTIKGIGGYTGSVKKTFKINPKPVKLTKLKAGKKKLTAYWKKGSGITGYQLQYSRKSSFASATKVTVSGTATLKKTLKGLKSGKKYYVRIRAYKKVGGKKYYSPWSKALSTKVK